MYQSLCSTQDECQSAYFAYESSTLFTTMIYFKEAEITCEEPYVIITDVDGIDGSKGHDKYAVSYFTKLTVKKFLARRNSDNYEVKSLKFFSDGTGQHFKQKYSICQVVTLNFPELEDVSWHFFATSHGKGPIDGLGGTIKRRVTEYAMANRQVDVFSTEDFARISKERCPNILIDFVPKSEVKQFIEKNSIQEGWKSNGKDILTAPSTRSCHVFKKRGSYSMTFGAHSEYVPDKEMKNHLFIKEGGVDHNPEFEVDQQSIGSLGPSNISLIDVPDYDITPSIDVPDDENIPSLYSKGEWVMVSYNNVKYLPGMILDHDEKEKEYFVRSMVAGTSAGFYIWPCNCDAPSSSLSECDKC